MKRLDEIRPEYTGFGERLKNLMTEHNMTHRTLAAKLNISNSLISEYCNGIKMPRMEKIDRLCQIFNCRRSDLLDPTEELTQDESELIQDYKLLIPEEKRIAKNLISDMAQKYKEKNAVGSAS